MALRREEGRTHGSHLVDALSDSQRSDGENSHEKTCDAHFVNTHSFSFVPPHREGEEGRGRLTHVELRPGGFEVDWSGVRLHCFLARDDVVRSCSTRVSLLRRLGSEKRTVNEGIHF